MLMATVADIVRQYGGSYLQKFGKKVPREHRKVLAMIARCRTGKLGTVVYRCQHCQRTHQVARSCGNRHCPACQQHKTKSWLKKQMDRLLPCPYFLLTFTVPASLRHFVRSHQQVCYAAMFRASSDTIRTLTADPKYIGSRNCGFFGVLHTWGRTLEYHPHLHYVVPGGAVSDDGATWLPSRADFLIPVKAASDIYRAKFRDEMCKAKLSSQIPPAVWKEAWVVHSQAVGDGKRSLQYLAPYVFRVAISDRRIAAVTPGPDGQGQVTFTYRKSGSRRWRQMTVTAHEFLRRFLNHVLPQGFQKIRSYGFAASVKRKGYELIRWLVTLAVGLTYILSGAPGEQQSGQSQDLSCPDCGGPLTFVAVLRIPLSFDTS